MNLPGLQSVVQCRRVRVVLYWFVGLFLFLILFGYFAIPPLARWAVESQGSKALGRVVSVEHVAFNPFTLTARIESLRIAEADAKRDFFTLRALEANLDTSSIWHRGAVLQRLRIENPALRIVRLDGQRYNFSDILERFAAQPRSEPGEPARFSLNNIQLVDGRIEFDDQPVQRQHLIEKLNIGVPFVSNLPARVDIFETPRLEALVNGSAMKLEGKVKPFASRREASLDLALAAFDITPYFAYAPGKLPVSVERGRLATDLHVVWSDSGANGNGQSLAVNGRAQLTGVSLKDGTGAALLAFDSLAVEAERIEPLAKPLIAKITQIRLDGPAADVQRAADGSLNLQRLAGAGSSGEKASVAQSTPVATGAPPQILVGKIEVHKGTVRWQDDAVAGGFKLALSPVELELSGFDLAGDSSAQFELRASTETGEAFAHSGQFVLSQGRFQGQVRADGVSLERLRPYFQDAVGPGRIQGMLGAQADYVVEPGKLAPVIRIPKASASLADFSVSDKSARQPLVSVPEMRVEEAALDLDKREIVLGSVSSKAARWRVSRNAKGAMDLLEALLPPAKPASRQTSVAVDKKAEPDMPWHLRLGQLQLAGWGIHFDDRSGSAPVALDVSDLGLVLKDWSSEPGSMANAEIKARVNKKGRLAVAGRFGAQPLKGDLKLDLQSVDLISIQPYVDKYFRVLVTRGAVSAKGSLAFDFSRADRPRARYAGGVAVEDFNSLDQINDTDFVRWKRFAFNGVKFELAPMALRVTDVRLDDFYTRLILDAQGRFNLRELATAEPEAAPASVAQSGPMVSVPATGASSTVASASAMPAIRVDKLVLSDGHVNYSDRFIKPNYDANLRDVEGSLAGLSTDQTSLARLELKARLDGAAPVEVAGELNPFRKDSFLDIKASVRDVDLTGVSTYAAKYVGYGIEKGKLSMNLEYKIRDRQLTAQNQVNLDQLTFGEKIDSPQATKLPVLFAVALLKNRRGEIDINLPISGTLDDPQFSVGGIIVRVIVNLISKAVTAPFALIGSLFGGGEELSSIDFPAGSAVLASPAEEKLRTLAKALADRPALRLEIAGVTDPSADRSGLKRSVLEGKMRAIKAASMVRRGLEVGEVDSLQIDQAEYPKLLEAVYSAEKIPNKPRNAIGIARSLPVDEMEKLLLGYLTVNDEDVQLLASKRAQVVRDWFIEKGEVAAERVFLLSSAAPADKGAGKPASPRVEFSLK